MHKEKKTRNTKQQELVLEALRSTDTHPSANDLFIEVRKELPRISLATVYRNLTKLEEQGWIQSLEPVGGQRRFDGNNQPHLHIRCRQCDRVDDAKCSFAPSDLLQQLRSMIDEEDFLIDNYNLELLGFCSKCHQPEFLENTG